MWCYIYCVIAVLVLAFITVVCSYEDPSIDQIFMKICLCLMLENLSKKDIYNILYKGFCCNISQQVLLQNTFSICDLFK